MTNLLCVCKFNLLKRYRFIFHLYNPDVSLAITAYYTASEGKTRGEPESDLARSDSCSGPLLGQTRIAGADFPVSYLPGCKAAKSMWPRRLFVLIMDLTTSQSIPPQKKHLIFSHSFRSRPTLAHFTLVAQRREQVYSVHTCNAPTWPLNYLTPCISLGCGNAMLARGCPTLSAAFDSVMHFS